MKAKLEFDLPEENNEFKLAQRGSDYFGVIWDTLNFIRGCLKYGHQYKTPDEALEETRKQLSEAPIDDIE